MTDHHAPHDLDGAEELDSFYREPDPWSYDSTPDDRIRVARLLTNLPRRSYRRVLDIGCGNGFLTVQLPGDAVEGCDVSEAAVGWARERAAAREDAGRFAFFTGSVLDLDPDALGTYDLVVITGVLYPQYIGGAFSLVQERVLPLLEDGGILASVHIDEWLAHRFSLTTLQISIDQYRDYSHRLEIFQK